VTNAERAREALLTVFSQDQSQLGRYYDPRFRDHVNRMNFEGIEEIVRSTALYRRLFPDLGVEFEHQVEEGNLVATRWVIRGRHLGREVRFPGVSMHRFEDEMIVECWDTADSVELIRQLGPWRSALMLATCWRELLLLARARR
jgi:predicted ester cyclase